ncbi:MAG: TIGR02710 family CRISPR-associated CARF protein [Thermostichales cyanobacterium BF4_bins_65]
MRILFVTVGGSPQPIVTAIQSLGPGRVIFVCSGGPKGSLSQVVGEGTPCEVRRGSEVEKLPNIPTQANLGARFNPATDVIELRDPDDLPGCYRQIGAVMADLGGQEVMADYTGGTKTMSVALALAALEYGAELVLTTGNRTDLIRVKQGEMTQAVDSAPILVQRALEKEIPNHLEQYNYGAVLVKLRQLVMLKLPQQQRRRVLELSDLCHGFETWDRFDHVQAFSYLRNYLDRKEICKQGLFLKRVIHSRSLLDPEIDPSLGTPGHGFEVIQDLLLNAERRAQQKRYDDALGRIYRALELLAQVRLKQAYAIDTGDLSLDKLPPSLQPAYQAKRNDKGKIQLGLMQSFHLLSEWNGDPLGEHFGVWRSRIQDTLQLRNYSLLAHGFRPVTEQDYNNQVVPNLVTFVKQALEILIPEKSKKDPLALNPLQMPQKL